MTTITKIFNFSLVLCLCLGFALNVSAQGISKHNIKKSSLKGQFAKQSLKAAINPNKKQIKVVGADKADLTNATARTLQNPFDNGGTMNQLSIWDIQTQFSHEDSVTAAATGFAGVHYVSALNEIWASDWTSDTLVRFTVSGSYIGFLRVTGLPTTGTGKGLRAVTSDGTNIYAANNTSTIYKLTYPGFGTTVTATSALTAPASVGTSGAVRWLSYDASGTPGLWVGNFNSTIAKITIPATPGAATVIGTPIPAATHGLTGMYGLTYDANAPGGPYFWAFDQGQAASGAVIVQVQVSTGLPTGVTHDVDADFGAAGGIAGGITVATMTGFTYPSVIALNQGVGIIAYEISPTVDGEATIMDPTNGLTMWPYSQNAPISFQGTNTNAGNMPLNAGTMDISLIEISTATPSLLNTFTATSGALATAGQTANYTATTTYTTPDTGLFLGVGVLSYPSDARATNDTAISVYQVTDTTFARDYADFGGSLNILGLGFGAAENGALGQSFPLVAPAKLTSISFALLDAYDGQPVSASVYAVVAGVPSTTPLATTTIHVVDSVNDNGTWLTLPLATGPVSLGAGDFLISINELGDSAVNIGTCPDIFMPGKVFVKWDSNNAGAWTDLGDFDIKVALLLRANFGCQSTNFAGAAALSGASCNGTGSATATVTGGTAPYTYLWSNNATTASITNVAAGSYSVTIKDGAFCSTNATVVVPTALAAITSSTPSSGSNGSATATVTGGTAPYTYSWNNGATTATITGLAVGSYCVTITDSKGCVKGPICSSVDASISIDPRSLGITSMNILPNPSTGIFKLNISLENTDGIKVNIYDLNGKSIFTTAKSGAVEYSENIDIQNFASGVYFMSVTTSKGTAYQRIVKQ